MLRSPCRQAEFVIVATRTAADARNANFLADLLLGLDGKSGQNARKSSCSVWLCKNLLSLWG